MQRIIRIAAVVAASLTLFACYSPLGRPDYTASGALAGAATGAVIGSAAGGDPGSAVLGAAVGTIVGSLIGHGLDQAQESQLRTEAPQTLQRLEEGQPLTVQDVRALARAGISDDLIISQIRNSRTIYHLTTADIIALKNEGISERVIDFMINTPSQMESSAQVGGVVGQTPPPPPSQTIIVAPGPDYVWVGGAWLWFGDRWIWNRGYWHRPLHPHYHHHHHGHRRHW